MKNVKNWLDNLEQPFRNQAINNLDKDVEHLQRASLRDALNSAFDWETSPEGWDYWNRLHIDL